VYKDSTYIKNLTFVKKHGIVNIEFRDGYKLELIPWNFLLMMSSRIIAWVWFRHASQRVWQATISLQIRAYRTISISP